MTGRSKEETADITLLGNQKTQYPSDYAPEMLETFENKHQGNDYFVKFNCPEFMKDLIKLMDPKYIEVWGKFTPRGGISIDPYCNYGKPGTKWEEIAFNRMANHDMYPEKVDNR